jgi:hypothetical protein
MQNIKAEVGKYSAPLVPQHITAMPTFIPAFVRGCEDDGGARGGGRGQGGGPGGGGGAPPGGGGGGGGACGRLEAPGTRGSNLVTGPLAPGVGILPSAFVNRNKNEQCDDPERWRASRTERAPILLNAGTAHGRYLLLV